MGIKSTCERMYRRANAFIHSSRVEWLGLRRGDQYAHYLREQFWRSFSRRHLPLRRHTRLLVDRIVELGHPKADAKVLCVGCRNTEKIRYFREKGLANVFGIDVYSESHDVLVMDMHAMRFSDCEFDIIYSAHSLEHSYDVGKVISEIVRVARQGALVAIEVPVRFSKTDTDLVDFGELDRLHAAFGSAIGTVLWSERESVTHPLNDQGTDVIRTIFLVKI